MRPNAQTADRLCSADLPDEKALRYGNRGTSERIFWTAKRSLSDAHGREFYGEHAGEAWELPRLGKMSFDTYRSADDTSAVFLLGQLGVARE